MIAQEAEAWEQLQQRLLGEWRQVWEAAGSAEHAEALAGLKKLAGVELSVLGAERIVARWSKASLALEPQTERVSQDLVIEIDGTKVHLEDGGREIKVASCFSWDCAQPEQHPEAVRHVAEWEAAERFRDTLWQEVLGRGVTTARTVAVLGDGAPWFWEMASYLFPYATQILDWYHLTEHLWRAAKVVSGEGKPETTALAKQWEKEMLEGRCEGVEAHLRELVEAGRDDAEHTLRKCADYLQTHQARLRYHLFRAAGWPIGRWERRCALMRRAA